MLAKCLVFEIVHKTQIAGARSMQSIIPSYGFKFVSSFNQELVVDDGELLTFAT